MLAFSLNAHTYVPNVIPTDVIVGVVNKLELKFEQNPFMDSGDIC